MLTCRGIKLRRSATNWGWAGLLGLWFLVLGCGGAAVDQKVVRIGYQKAGTLSLVKARKTLESRLAELGYSVAWTEFPSGPPMLEALHVGSIDYGHTGDSPPIFAQSAGVSFVYVAASAPSPRGSGILVRADSPIKEPVDLRGRNIALVRGSSAHWMLLRTLDSAGLSLSDVGCRFLAPADGYAALRQGSVDAWSIWDPYLAAAEQDGQTRLLLSGEGLVSGREFYLASNEFAAREPELVEIIRDETDSTGQWALAHPEEVAKILAPSMGLDVQTVEIAERRRGRHGVVPMDGTIVAEQQAIADSYRAIGLIPERIVIGEAVLREGRRIPSGKDKP
jgi:sulfonate transport system substrate-binding protein